jgi:hypothetical protein
VRGVHTSVAGLPLPRPLPWTSAGVGVGGGGLPLLGLPGLRRFDELRARGDDEFGAREGQTPGQCVKTGQKVAREAQRQGSFCCAVASALKVTTFGDCGTGDTRTGAAGGR